MQSNEEGAGHRRLTVEEVYAEAAVAPEEVAAILNASLGPRGPSLLFDLVAELGITSATHALDVGCRDGRHLRELHGRFGCRVTGIDLVAANLAQARPGIGDGPFALVQGRAESLPFAAGCFDLVWVRDVLIHIEAVATALAECRRVVRLGAPVLVFQMFATPRLEPAEAARLWPPLAAVPRSADRAWFEEAIGEAGLRIEQRIELSSEWREFLEEHEDGRTSRQLLWVARLLRRPDHYKEALGEADYNLELANGLWGVYQMIGKLSPAVYVLR